MTVLKALPLLLFPGVTPHSQHLTPCRHSAGASVCHGYSSHLLPMGRRKLRSVCSALAHCAGQDSELSPGGKGSSSDRTVNILLVRVSIPISQIISKPREYTEDEGKQLSIP